MVQQFPVNRRCPNCNEPVREHAPVCEECGEYLAPERGEADPVNVEQRLRQLRQRSARG
jgi:predicted amidophosphoribosyltransferase